MCVCASVVPKVERGGRRGCEGAGGWGGDHQRRGTIGGDDAVSAAEGRLVKNENTERCLHVPARPVVMMRSRARLPCRREADREAAGPSPVAQQKMF